jgi:hypothetical protein
MRCPHCHTTNPEPLPFARSLDGGRVYAQICSTCGHVLGLRPRLDTDPPAAPAELSDAQVAHLQFIRWLWRERPSAQDGPPDFPLNAA